jgi:hypothetical protein
MASNTIRVQRRSDGPVQLAVVRLARQRAAALGKWAGQPDDIAA